MSALELAAWLFIWSWCSGLGFCMELLRSLSADEGPS